MLALSINYHAEMSQEFTESDSVTRTAICTDQKCIWRWQNQFKTNTCGVSDVSIIVPLKCPDGFVQYEMLNEFFYWINIDWIKKCFRVNHTYGGEPFFIEIFLESLCKLQDWFMAVFALNGSQVSWTG